MTTNAENNNIVTELGAALWQTLAELQFYTVLVSTKHFKRKW